MKVRHTASPVSPGCRVASTLLQSVTVKPSSGIFIEISICGRARVAPSIRLLRRPWDLEADPVGLAHLDGQAAGVDGLAGRERIGDAVHAHHGKAAALRLGPRLAYDLPARRHVDARLGREAIDIGERQDA